MWSPRPEQEDSYSSNKSLAMREISNSDFDFARDIINEFISQNKDSRSLTLYNRVRRAKVMMRKWSKKA